MNPDNRRVAFLFCILSAGVVFAVEGYLLAQSSENYSIPKSALNSGGALSHSDNYEVIHAIGESAESVAISSESYAIHIGMFGGTGMGNASMGHQENNLIPEAFILYQNYPNPFNPKTDMFFALPENSFVELKIFNIFGREIRCLVAEEMKTGYHHVTWNGLDHSGQLVSSGIYIYLMQAGNFRKIRKMSYIK